MFKKSNFQDRILTNITFENELPKNHRNITICQDIYTITNESICLPSPEQQKIHLKMAKLHGEEKQNLKKRARTHVLPALPGCYLIIIIYNALDG